MMLHSGNKYQVIGTMSGTSLDGLDLAAVEFTRIQDKWAFSILAAETYTYSGEWEDKLKKAPSLSGGHLMELHTAYGRFTANRINRFINTHKLQPALIASHGHTVFHQPEKAFTFQLGHGASIAAETGITTIADFRSGDVALGGQGAPLVPVGDRLLFHEYDMCLNLGGFANISFELNGERLAFDICPVNIILNDLAMRMGKQYDAGGELGRTGKVRDQLLSRLNHLDFYREKPPKSLGREWLENCFIPLLEETTLPAEDKLRTLYEHIAIQIAGVSKTTGSMLVTGGGAFNTFLLERIREHMSCELVLPSETLVNYKEALIFALLGLLRHLGEINCYSSVTGAKRDSSTGVIYN